MEVEAALIAHAMNPSFGQFPPKPADIIRLLGGSEESHLAVAWADFRQATRSGEMPKDQILSEVIRRMGGLDRLGEMNSRDVDFLKKNFDALYMAHKEPTRLGISTRKSEAIE